MTRVNGDRLTELFHCRNGHSVFTGYVHSTKEGYVFIGVCLFRRGVPRPGPGLGYPLPHPCQLTLPCPCPAPPPPPPSSQGQDRKCHRDGTPLAFSRWRTFLLLNFSFVLTSERGEQGRDASLFGINKTQLWFT